MRFCELLAPFVPLEEDEIDEAFDPLCFPSPEQLAADTARLASIARRRSEEDAKHSRKLKDISDAGSVGPAATTSQTLANATKVAKAAERRRAEIERHNSVVARLNDQARK